MFFQRENQPLMHKVLLAANQHVVYITCRRTRQPLSPLESRLGYYSHCFICSSLQRTPVRSSYHHWLPARCPGNTFPNWKMVVTPTVLIKLTLVFSFFSQSKMHLPHQLLLQQSLRLFVGNDPIPLPDHTSSPHRTKSDLTTRNHS